MVDLRGCLVVFFLEWFVLKVEKSRTEMIR